MDEHYCPHDGVPTVGEDLFDEDDAFLEPGTVLEDRYRIEKMLSQGGMGAVYIGTQVAMRRRVVVKTVLRSYVSSRRHVQRFYQEAQAASRLGHPNIIRIFDFGIDPKLGVPFMVMEHLAGKSIQHIVQRRSRLTEVQACAWMEQIARGLVEAHGHDIIHRDLKPDNVFVTGLLDGRELIKILDFGLAKLLDEAGEGSDPNLTETGAILGTPLYMSPEQFHRSGVDARSDLYSLGCILHFMLTGQPPFEATDKVQVAIKQLTMPSPPLPDFLVDGKPPSKALIALHEKLLSKTTDARPKSALAVAQYVGAIALGETPDASLLGPRGPEGPRPERTPSEAVPEDDAARISSPPEVGDGALWGAPQAHADLASVAPAGGSYPYGESHLAPLPGPVHGWGRTIFAAVAFLIAGTAIGLLASKFFGDDDKHAAAPTAAAAATAPAGAAAPSNVAGPAAPTSDAAATTDAAQPETTAADAGPAGAGAADADAGPAAPAADLPAQLSPAVIKDVLGKRRKGFDACWPERERRKARRDKKRGDILAEVTLQIVVVGTDGHVDEAKVIGAKEASDTVQACVMDALDGTAFPAFSDKQMIINYPVRFR